MKQFDKGKRNKSLAFLFFYIYIQNMDFDENLYLESYSDVKKAVKKGLFNSGYDHYLKFGHREGRFIAKETVLYSPSITCILISHNKPEYVKQAIESVLNQDHKDWQCVIMDSGVLYDRNYFDWIKDERVEIFKTNENEYLRSTKSISTWCINEAFRRNFVKGYLVCYLCDDDILYSNAFSTFVEFVKKNPTVKAMYASQDCSVSSFPEESIIVSERKASILRGCNGLGGLDGLVDYLQFCHAKEVLKWFITQPEYWPESKETETHADGIFMDRVGNLVLVHPIDVKTGQNRRTYLSTYQPYLG